MTKAWTCRPKARAGSVMILCISAFGAKLEKS